MGPIPDDHDIHHKNDDPTDDRLSNIEPMERDAHRHHSSTGDANARYIEVPDELMLQLYLALLERKSPKPTFSGRVTKTIWNSEIRARGLKGKVPFANGVGRVQGMSWDEHLARMERLRQAANDRVYRVSVERELTTPISLYWMEVAGDGNFAVTSTAGYPLHTLIVNGRGR